MDFKHSGWNFPEFLETNLKGAGEIYVASETSFHRHSERQGAGFYISPLEWGHWSQTKELYKHWGHATVLPDQRPKK